MPADEIEPRRIASAIHIGVNAPVLRESGVEIPRLRSAEIDAVTMRALSDEIGASSRFLVGASATRESVLDALSNSIGRLESGDLLVLSFAGHGVRLSGPSVEDDGVDEAWCLHDGVLVDDELSFALSCAPRNSEIVVVTDACFAGGMVDRPPGSFGAVLNAGFPRTFMVPDAVRAGIDPKVLDFVGRDSKLTFRSTAGALRGLTFAVPRPRGVPPMAPRPIEARVVVFGAAGEGSLAIEGEGGGLFTAAFAAAIRDTLNVDASYGDIAGMIARLLGHGRPTIHVGGSGSGSVLERSAFRRPGPPPFVSTS